MDIKINDTEIEKLVKAQVNQKITEKVNSVFKSCYSNKDYIEYKIREIVEEKINGILEENLDGMIYEVIQKCDKKQIANNIKTEFVEGLLDKLTEREW